MVENPLGLRFPQVGVEVLVLFEEGTYTHSPLDLAHGSKPSAVGAIEPSKGGKAELS